MRIRKAFTLIELLVVVAVIGILVALLLPYLSRAKAQAKSAACLANLKAIGNGFSNYAGNNNAMVPDGGRDNFQWDQSTGAITAGGTLGSWPEELVADGAVKMKFSQNSSGTVNQWWATGRRPFYCPASDEEALKNGGVESGTGNEVASTGYGMSYYAGSIWYRKAPPGSGQITAPILPGDAKPPNTMRINYWSLAHIVAYDAGSVDVAGESGEKPYNTNPPGKPWNGDIDVRHFGGANYLFGDGHAERSNLIHTYDKTKPTIHPELAESANDPSIWSHPPYGIRGTQRP